VNPGDIIIADCANLWWPMCWAGEMLLSLWMQCLVSWDISGYGSMMSV